MVVAMVPNLRHAQVVCMITIVKGGKSRSHPMIAGQ